MISDNAINNLINDAKLVWPVRWEEIEPLFQKCSLSASIDVLIKHLGLFNKKGDFETLDTIKSKINIFKDAEYVFQKMLDILVEEKILEKKDNGYSCINQDIDIPGPAEYLVEAVRKIPEEGAAFQWLARGYSGLVQFIKGKVYGEEVMFPFNDFSLASDVYYTSNVYNFWSKLAGKAVKRIIEDKYNKKIVMLEVGAGTGNGTWNVFENMENPQDKLEKYIFTDISKSLVKKTSKSERFNKYNFIEYKILDATKEIKEQGLEEEGADIVLAVNVLHATPNLVDGCKSFHKLVKKDGFVIIGEIAPPPNGLYRYMELTFGLLASYYNYIDKDIRPNCPIVRPETWVKVFKLAGFSDVLAIPGDRLEGCDRGGVVIAQK